MLQVQFEEMPLNNHCFRFCYRTDLHNCRYLRCYIPSTAVERSKERTAFARSEAGIVASNPTQGMDV
jgi:hypothetical protein